MSQPVEDLSAGCAGVGGADFWTALARNLCGTRRLAPAGRFDFLGNAAHSLGRTDAVDAKRSAGPAKGGRWPCPAGTGDARGPASAVWEPVGCIGPPVAVLSKERRRRRRLVAPFRTRM